MLLPLLLLSTLSFASSVSAAFGFTKSGNNYVVDAGSSEPLVFTVSGTSCDITSIKYRNVELQGQTKGSHISSGLGSATVSATTISGKYVKITCATSTLTHYLVVKSGESTIYMATHITAEPDIGELRFIARLQSSKLPSEYPYGSASTTAGSSATVEGSDVFVVGGQTRSKFYSSTRFIDKDAQCVYGGGGSDEVHVCMLAPQPESSSGGPFFRDIESNNAGDDTNLYWYMNSGHVQTEAWRVNVLHGPYMLVFSRSGVPSVKDADLAFFSELDVKGFVPAAARGYVAGTASGVPSGLQAVVHWYNSAAQYWAVAGGGGGSFKSPPMKAGSYTMVLYQGEYKVATATAVTVSAGATTQKNIASALASHASLWKIGEYDGQPTGFMNADKFLRMHPSDGRMTAWKPATYTVGSPLSQFPMALFQNVNNPVTIKFDLASAPAGSATLRIATTLSFAGSRPQAKVNSWSGPSPAAPTKIDSRGVTRGAYRGYGEVYDVAIPSGTLVKGSNTVTISSISGSSGTTFLNPNIIFDCVELFTG